MIQYSDIHDAIAQRDRSDLEDAFRAFVGFPGEEEITGIPTLDGMVQTFEEVCEALRGDMGLMPGGTVDMMVEVAERHDVAMPNTRYASGAKTALDCMAHFRAQFAHHLDGEAGWR